MAAAFLNDLGNTRKTLKKTETKGEIVNLQNLLSTEPTKEDDEERRNYFFQSGIDEWYESISQFTFRSEFVAITSSEAKAFISYWNEVTSKDKTKVVTPEDIPLELSDLVIRLDDIIQSKFSISSSSSSHSNSNSDGVFVKLSTRSPKDSYTVFRKAATAFEARCDENGNVPEYNNSTSSMSKENARMISFSEEMLRAAAVTNGTQAMIIMLDSYRVAEDLMYAYEDGEEKKKFSLSLVVRAWDSRIRPQCEFRGFVWGKKLNCIGQYWHSLYLPELAGVKEQIASDILSFYESIKDSMPVPNAMLDLAWLGPGQGVILIEINPLMEGLGSFKGSTGLFDFYKDEGVLTGTLPFELRLREKEEEKAELISHMNMEWRKIIFQF